jgi:hypothetical protein
VSSGTDEPYFDGPVINWILPMPLALAAQLVTAVGEECARLGGHAYTRKEDGIGIVWVRFDTPPRIKEEPEEQVTEGMED